MTIPAQPSPGDGPLAAGQALLLVNAVNAIVLAALASKMPGPAWRRAGTLFVLSFTVESLLSWVEAVWFGDFLHLPEGMMAGVTAVNAIKSAGATIVAGLLWRPGGSPAPIPAGLWWKLPAIAALYILAYFGAGFLIAWPSAAVRAYYGQGVAIDTGPLALLQVGRGAVWACLALLAACSLKGPAGTRAVLTGAAFSILMASALLYPNSFMPWPVRSAHLLEVGLSNFLFGMAAVLILSMGNSVDRKKRGDAARLGA